MGRRGVDRRSALYDLAGKAPMDWPWARSSRPGILATILALLCLWLAPAKAFAAITMDATPLPDAIVGKPFSATRDAQGCLGICSFRGENLPDGIRVGFGGLLHGIPTSAGVFTFKVVVTDLLFMGYAEHTYTLKINPAVIALLPPGSPDASWKVPYREVFSVSGGVPPYSFYQSGSLPPGLTWNNGELSGTPTKAGSFTVYVCGNDSASNTFCRFHPLTVQPPTVIVNPGGLPNPTVGAAYSQSLSASGGDGPYKYAASGLPAGLAVSPAGTISGTPTETGPFNVIVTAEDSNSAADGGPFTGSRGYSITVQPPAITLDPVSLANGAVGSAYSHTFSPSGGTLPHKFSHTGQLPAGLSLDSSGVLSGTPKQAGTFPFTVTATDSTGGQGPYRATTPYTLSVGAPAIKLDPASLPDPAIGTHYSQFVSASGGTSPYTYSLVGGDRLPDGLELSTGGEIRGMPTQVGDFSFTIRATDNSTGTGAPFSTNKIYTMKIAAPIITIAPSALVNGVVGTAYSQTLTASGGAGGYGFSAPGADLPKGLVLDAGGTLSGTPTQAGSYNFTVTATDSLGFAVTRSYTVAVNDSATSGVTPNTLADATAGTPYSQVFTASGGIGPYTFSRSLGNPLPPGLKISAEGVLSGTPTAAGRYAFTIVAKDSGASSWMLWLSLVVKAPTIALTPTALPNGTGGVAYNQKVTASGGTAPYGFIASGKLPDGLSLSADGTLSGIPTISGSFDFTITATDKTGGKGPFTGSQAYQLVVDVPTVAIGPATLPEATGGSAYSETITASGGTAPYNFTISDGALPAGLALKADGTLSGTPDEAGSFDFTVKATDAHGFFSAKPYTLAVSAPVPAVTDIRVDLLAGTSETVSLTSGASGGPFTAAAVVAAPAAADGSARIEGGGGSYDLVFASTASASGAVVVTYTLSNPWGVSAPGTVTFNVATRPNPAQDPEVTGLVAAQVEAANRLAAAQTRNFNGRLEQLHDESQRHASPVSIQLGLTSDTKRPLGYAQDDRDRQQSGTTLGFPMDRLAGRQGETPKAMAVWASGFVNFGQRDGAIDLKQTLVGVSGGVDYRFSPCFVGGIGFGYGREGADIGSNGTRNEAAALSVAAYGSYSPVANIFIDGLLGYSRLDFDSRRFVTATGDFASGTRNGQQVFGSFTTAYEHGRDGWLLSPYGRLEASWSRLDTYTEAGAGLFNLVYGEQSMTTLAGMLGLRAQYAMATGWGVLTPKARLEYTHDFSGSSRASMGYADLGNGLPYGFDIESSDRDHFGFGLGFDASFGDGWLLGFDYSTALPTSGSSQDHSIAVRIGSRW